MNFYKLLRHLAGAVAIITAPAIVSPTSSADVARMDAAAQEMTRLRDYPLAMSPTELVAWRLNAKDWIDYWISFLDSIDLKNMSESSNSDLAYRAKVNLIVLSRLKGQRELYHSQRMIPERLLLAIVYAMSDAVILFDPIITPFGMDYDKILEKFQDGHDLSTTGMHHAISVNLYYFDNYRAAQW